jgi:[acyl-carrier-protein] S-malonyltransferase
VIAGKIPDIDVLVKRLKRFKSVEVKHLNISTPSHCPLLREAAVALREELEKYQYKGFKNPVVSNVTGRPYPDADSLTDALTAHMIEPVQWYGAMAFMKEKKVNHFIDVGPQAVLKNLTAFITTQVPAYAFDSVEEHKSIKNALQPDPFQRRSLVRKCLAVAVSTKNYNYDQASYSAEVIPPYRELAALNGRVGNNEPAREQMFTAYALLLRILEAKQVPLAVRQRTLEEAFGAEEYLLNRESPA